MACYIKTLDLTNHKGRVFYTTDLHGCYDLLHEKLHDVAFDSHEDIIILGGDCCDRGPDSRYVLDYLNEPWIHCIRGNHEELLMGAYEEGFVGPYTDCLVINGGQWVADLDQSTVTEIYETFKSLPLAIEIITPNEKIGIIHAECPYNDWDKFKTSQVSDSILNTVQWARNNYTRRWQGVVQGVDRLMVGHTPTDSGEVEVLGNTWYCDLGSFFRGNISFIQLV